MDEIGDRIGDDHPPTGPQLKKASRAGGPVTCVSFLPLSSDEQSCAVARLWALGPYLFSSCGNGKSASLIFPKGGSIHGISFEDVKATSLAVPRLVAVFGGRQLAFCYVLCENIPETPPKLIRSSIYHDGKTQSHLIASSWIWDVMLLSDPNSDGTTAAIGLSNHIVELWKIESIASKDEGSDSSIQHALCYKRVVGHPSCLVTSMNMLQQGDRLVVAAGTAFQIIQIWSIPLSEVNNDHVLDEECSRALEGHAGIIHSVQFSKDGRFLASTSDDRSVRLWEYSKDNSGTSWQKKWVGWGHTARVWSVAFISDAVASVAEDATIRIWSFESGATIATIPHSSGLWSITTWNDFAMVGATDGTVAVYNLPQRIPGRLLEVVDSIAIPDDRPSQTNIDCVHPDKDDRASIQKKNKSPKLNAQVVVGMKWVDQDTILVGTRAGSLFLWNSGSNDWHQCSPWWDTALLEEHGIVSTEGCCMALLSSNRVAIGTTRGDIVVVTYAAQQKSSARGRLVLSARSLRSVQALKLFREEQRLVSFHVRSVALWNLDVEQAATEESDPIVIFDVSTKGVPICCAYDGDKDQMIVGDSRGNISLFQFPSSPCGRGSAIEATSSIHRLHQKEHVTSIVIIGKTVLSSGNDGCLYASYCSGQQLERGFSIPVSSLTGISRIWSGQTSQSSLNRLMVAGYYGNIYRIVNVTTGHVLFQIDTGGRQRILDLYLVEDALVGREAGRKQVAVCMNHKNGINSLQIHREVRNDPSSENRFSNIEDGVAVHGETIFDACLFCLGTTEEVRILFTASEDCGSKLFLCSEEQLVDSIALTPQESCVRAVCNSQIDPSSTLLVVGGGKLTLQFFLAFSRSAGCSSLADISIRFIGKRTNRQNAAIDQRINAVKALPLMGTDRLHLVLAGDSAGQCHLYTISEDPNHRPSLGIVFQATNCPILSIALSHVSNRILVALGTTAGDIVLYELPTSVISLQDTENQPKEIVWRPVAMFQAHQMGTNSISMVITMTDEVTAEVMLLSAGDDQAITLCRLKMTFSTSNPPEVSTRSMVISRDASFSALKGIALIGGSTAKYFLATGYSQQISLWRIVDGKSPESPTRLEVVKHLPVDVGDVNALAATRSGEGTLAVVVGLGMELFLLSGV